MQSCILEIGCNHSRECWYFSKISQVISLQNSHPPLCLSQTNDLGTQFTQCYVKSPNCVFKWLCLRYCEESLGFAHLLLFRCVGLWGRRFRWIFEKQYTHLHLLGSQWSESGEHSLGSCHLENEIFVNFSTQPKKPPRPQWSSTSSYRSLRTQSTGTKFSMWGFSLHLKEMTCQSGTEKDQHPIGRITANREF